MSPAAEISDSGPSENEGSLKVEISILAARRKFAQEFKAESCREVINTSKPIKDAAEAEAYGVGYESLRLTAPAEIFQELCSQETTQCGSSDENPGTA